MKFWGYIRSDGKVGIRNYTLIVPNGRMACNLTALMPGLVSDVKTFIPLTENGRNSEDRRAIARSIVGLAKNPNVGAVLVLGQKRDSGYPEFKYDNLVSEIARAGKPVDEVFVESSGGFHNAVGEAMRKARMLSIKASECVREQVSLGELSMAVKCGFSDATSGMAGNPTVAHLFDNIVEAGGTAMFSETTEIIGAEHLVAKRFEDPEERKKFLAAVARVEEEAKATGEDIRTINPIPANISAGLTTLEEKSLGAVKKAGSGPIKGCLEYAEIPKGRGLYFMDSWMCTPVLMLGFAAAGSVLNIFQLGGGWFPKGGAMPTANAGIVTPTLYITGNPRTWENLETELDFNAGSVISERESIESAGTRLTDCVCKIASGKLTKGETLNIRDCSMDVYLRGPGI